MGELQRLAQRENILRFQQEQAEAPDEHEGPRKYESRWCVYTLADKLSPGQIKAAHELSKQRNIAMGVCNDFGERVQKSRHPDQDCMSLLMRAAAETPLRLCT